MIRVINSRRMRWAVDVTRIGEMGMHTVLWLENLKGRGHSEDLGVDGKIVLQLSYGTRVGWCELDAYGSG
jgi:hypothetical protein